jgi:hypothetical protein
MYHLPRLLKPAEAAVDVVPVASAPAAGSKTAASGGAAVPAAAPQPPVVGDNYLRNAHADTTSSDAPQSLYILAATLIMTNLVDLEDLLPYLRPSLDRLADTLKALDADLTQQANSYGVVSLNSTKPATGKPTENKLGGTSTSTGGGSGGANKESPIPLSADVTKDVAVRPSATSSARKPPAPPTPAVSTGVTMIPPAPPTVKPLPAASAGAAKGPATAAASAPSASGISPRVGSNTALSRTQSTTKLGGSGTKTADAVEPEVDPAKFSLFYEPSVLGIASAEADKAESAELSKDKAPSASANGAYAEGNEVLGLICALLSLRGWEQAKYLLNVLELQGMDPLLVAKYSPDLRCALAALISWQQNAVYRQHNVCGAGHGFGVPLSILPVRTAPNTTVATNTASMGLTINSKFAAAYEQVAGAPVTPQFQLLQVEELQLFPTQAGPLLSFCGYHVRQFPALFAKLCRLCRAFVRQVVSNSAAVAAVSGAEVALEPVLNVICNVLLPALSAQQEVNPFLAGQVWETIRALPFAQRFAAYDRWYGGGKDLLRRLDADTLCVYRTVCSCRR